MVIIVWDVQWVLNRSLQNKQNLEGQKDQAGLTNKSIYLWSRKGTEIQSAKGLSRTAGECLVSE